METVRIKSELRYEQGVPVLDVVGEIDLYSTPEFRDTLTDVLESGATVIVVNMAKVNYMDSSGFGALLSATKRLRPLNGSLILCNCNDAIRRMLQITRLDRVFGVYPTVDDAVTTAKESLASIGDVKVSAVAVA